MSLILRNPRRRFRNEFANGQRKTLLPVDVYDNEEQLVVTASVPGAKADSINIFVEDNVLTIKGEIAARDEEQEYLFVERFQGHFKRALKLNVPVKVGEIEASFEDGVLTVVLPKSEEARPKQIVVQAK